MINQRVRQSRTFDRGAINNNWKRIAVSIACMLTLIVTGPVTACSFCPPGLGPSLLTQCDDGSAAVLAELVRAPESESKNPVSRTDLS